ncbi:ankyrin repeat domain-containing protein 40-like protein [Willisornis vidua]|uniref:Ankyrin repeat domain-containing protein 40-like protein n=2 Tax=Passeriformes TaxID=9126 RepID=A0ABQ9DMJ9_9PASS|nr:ankyrin repeat domain-containing protein 40-like protein [Willisornis vidua]
MAASWLKGRGQAASYKHPEKGKASVMDEWTCLHWACKRNHARVVSCLLEAGADRHILTAKGELAAQLTSKPDIRRILGANLPPRYYMLMVHYCHPLVTLECDVDLRHNRETIQNEKDLSNNMMVCFLSPSSTSHFRTSLVEEETECQGVTDLDLPVVANYLANPPFPYVYTEESIPDSLAESQNESASISSASQCETSPCPSAAQVESVCTPSPCSSEEDCPALDAAAPPPPAATAPARAGPGVPNGPACPPAVPPGTGLCSPGVPGQARPLQPSSSLTSPTPAFQPFFFTRTFPYNVQELVLKVRVQNLRDNDFIEIELDRQELTYQDLLRVSCCELGVNPEQVEKIRKLPNTLVRKDKDVARLQDFQELELVLVRSDSSPFRNAAAALTERPCYNSRASKLTY